MSSYEKALSEIQLSQSFGHLESYKDAGVWQKMNPNEKELLARLFLLQGAKKLDAGDPKYIDSFNWAKEVTSSSPLIMYQIGILYSDRAANTLFLKRAHESFSQAHADGFINFDSLYRHALILLQLAFQDENDHYFYQASEYLEQAEKLIENTDFVRSDFYWRWGTCLSLIGRHSGEPQDFLLAVEKLRKAEDFGCNDEEFYDDYGHCMADLATLLDNQTYFYQALKFFQKAVAKNSSYFDGWLNIVLCVLRISEKELNEEFLYTALEACEVADSIQPDHGSLWSSWARVETLFGKYYQDPAKFTSSLDRFAKAHELTPDDPKILTSWVELLLFLGSHLDQLEHLQQARVRIMTALEINPDDSHAWFLYGSALNELGRYFEDENYYWQAVEKFQYGLTLESPKPLNWYGLAESHFAIGEFNQSLESIEKANDYFMEAEINGLNPFGQFYNDWGVCLLKLGEITHLPETIQTAIEKFEKAVRNDEGTISIDQVDLEWVYNYGCSFDLLGDLTEDSRYYEKSVEILSEVLLKDPNYVFARYNLALAIFHLADANDDFQLYYQSIQHFHVLLEINPEDGIIQMDYGLTLIHFAVLLQDAHDEEKSGIIFREAEQHLLNAAQTGFNETYYHLACLYALTDHHERAIHCLEKAHQLKTLPPMDDIFNDEWMEKLRDTKLFREFIQSFSTHNDDDE